MAPLSVQNNGYLNLRSPLVSPDNDGINDFIIIDYELPEANYISDVYLYDHWGRNRGKLLNNYTLQQKGTVIIKELHWVDRGVYIVFVTLHHLSGKVSLVKLVLRVL